MYASAHPTPPRPRSAFDRFLIRRWDYRHPRPGLAFRLMAGCWNACLGLLLLGYGFYWIAWLPLVASVVTFWAAHRIWVRVQG